MASPPRPQPRPMDFNPSHAHKNLVGKILTTPILAAQSQPQTKLAGPWQLHQSPIQPQGKYKHVEHYSPGRWMMPLINDPIVEDLAVEEAKQALLKKQIKDEKDRISLKRDNFKSALKANEKKFSHLQKDLKSKHHDILNLKHELDLGLPKPPIFPNIEFFNHDAPPYPLDFNSTMMQHLQSTTQCGTTNLQSQITLTILDPLRDSQTNLKTFRNQLSLLKTEKKILKKNIKTVKDLKNTAKDTFDSHLDKIDRKKEEIFDCIKEIRILKESLLGL
jgi:hypothetical protein